MKACLGACLENAVKGTSVTDTDDSTNVDPKTAG